MNQMNFAFISRHVPTQSKIDLAAAQGITLVPVGYMNAFTVDPQTVHGLGIDNGTPFDGVVVVHPAAALRLCEDFLVGIFENANRAEVGQPPKFEAVSFHLFDLRD